MFRCDDVCSGCTSEVGLYLRLGRVRAQVHALECEDVVLGVLAVLERVVAGDFEGFVEWGDVDGAAEEAGPRGYGGGQEGRGEEVEELHGGGVSLSRCSVLFE